MSLGGVLGVVEVLHVECLLQIRVGHVEEVIGGLSRYNNSERAGQSTKERPQDLGMLYDGGYLGRRVGVGRAAVRRKETGIGVFIGVLGRAQEQHVLWWSGQPSASATEQ